MRLQTCVIVIAPAAGVRRPWLPVEHSGRRFVVCDGDCVCGCVLLPLGLFVFRVFFCVRRFVICDGDWTFSVTVVCVL